jgi:hypothetical protein
MQIIRTEFFFPPWLSVLSWRISMPVPGSGFGKIMVSMAILGAVTMALFIKIAGRKRESHPILPFSMTSSNTSTQQNTG